MPEKGSIDGDWTTGRKGGGWTESKKKLPWQHQRLRLEEGGELKEVFEERRALLGKWFDKWTDSQRRRILTGLLERCSLSQQKFCCQKLQEKIPAEALDFTTKLPRVLSLYIFSFLDPRSLCRCAQGIWKKHYIQMVKELHVTKPKTPPKDGFSIANVQPVTSRSPGEKQSPASAFRSSSSLRKKTHAAEKELPPWRSSDKHPTDIIRFNYLDNCDPIEQIWQGRRKRHEMNPDFSRQSRDKKNKLQDRSRLRKAQSLISLSAEPSAPLQVPTHLAWSPHWWAGLPATEAATKILMQHLQRHSGLQALPS
ncbi:F-box only protein 16 isoform X3 [Canis lupus familiaris]|uniref:F-box only protein 16 isoform X3 n=1 Tax=Canis lupus familiaris TaxID=9615 RepID=UPI0006B3DEDD|nr:F-box only protein 16 isoform X3 [Canis lupus familiaris]XP_025318767.1 F-box only protein 16 isoform X2 [Canis lupus dingo]XP_038291245.1 F-box only protein 16 isoform X3 [Canis lupus familiaris]|eukprot:XP_013963098.1 F-box only protein 16 isoform X3 [Canis lupus familiaris]